MTGTEKMNNGCFGKLLNEDAHECLICEVREECSIAMSQGRKLPCFGKEYDSNNFACSKICVRGQGGEQSECAIAMSQGITELEPTMEDIDMISDTVNDEQMPVETANIEEEVVEEVEEVEAASETQPEAVVETPKLKKPKRQKSVEDKVTKKSVIEKALKVEGGATADEVVVQIKDAGLIDDTPDEIEKTRHYVIMTISHMRRDGVTVSLKEGRYGIG